MSEKLEKNIGGLVTALVLGGGSASAPAPHDPHTLHHELQPIAQLESSGGKFTAHKPSIHGELDTAHGALGFKPKTAFEEYTKSKHLQALYPNLPDVQSFTHEFKTNPQFYNHVAAAHWNRLKKVTGSAANASFSWRHGLGAFKNTRPEDVAKDPYVQKYIKMHVGGQSLPLAKSESDDLLSYKYDLKKEEGFASSIGKIARGNVLSSTGDKSVHDYSHVLGPNSNGFKLHVHQDNLSHLGGMAQSFKAHVLGPNSEPVGTLEGYHDKDSGELNISNSEMHPKARGKGLGSAMYEAMMAHGVHQGASSIAGTVHSSSASKVHQKLSLKHGLNYKPEMNVGSNTAFPNQDKWNQTPSSDYDRKFKAYNYALKSESFEKSLKEWVDLHGQSSIPE